MNRTVLRTVEILEIISKHGEISLADLVKITGYPKTSVYDPARPGRACHDIQVHR